MGVEQHPDVGLGLVGVRRGAAVVGPPFGGVQDRAVSWAFLSRNESDRVTMYVSVHLPTEKSAVSAGELGLDYALLGPVLPTPTHPEAAGLGWAEFARQRDGNTLPVFALGGMKKETLDEAQAHGAHGIALMRGW